LYSCRKSSRLELTLELAGNNRPELETATKWRANLVVEIFLKNSQISCLFPEKSVLFALEFIYKVNFKNYELKKIFISNFSYNVVFCFLQYKQRTILN
jgi:hypothetical protein